MISMTEKKAKRNQKTTCMESRIKQISSLPFNIIVLFSGVILALSLAQFS